MKICKSDDMAFIFKSFSAGGKDFLSVAACAFFSLDLKETQERLAPEQEMWPVIEASLGKNEIFDFGVPKRRAEFLVYGSCFSPEPVKGVEIRVVVGNTSKSLDILGNMHWTVLGTSDSEPFTVMPVDYPHAFGGEGFAENPFGKGLNPDKEGVTPLPNIQDKNCPMGSCGDRPDPAGFAAYPMTWPQRMQYFGRIDENYLIESWPNFPNGTDPEYFNAAPPDQRIEGFFTGNEKIEIHNMHPQQPLLKSMLPGLRARIFVHMMEKDNEVFREIIARPETLWLFPDKERGILLFRSSTEITDEDFDDVLHCFAGWENLSDEPKPIDYYYKLFLEELNPSLPAEAATEAPSPQDTFQEKLPGAHAEESVRPELAVIMKDAQELEAKATAQLKKLGLTPEDALKKYFPQSAAGGAISIAELEQMIIEMDKHTKGMMQKYNISEKDVIKILEPKPQPAPMSVDEMVAGFRKAGIVRPDLEDQLKEAERIGKEAEKGLDDLKKKSEEAAKAAEDRKQPAADVPSEPAAAAKTLTAEEAVERYKTSRDLRGLNLAGLDFTGLDFTGADFTGGILEKTVFKKGKLDDAVFAKTRLIGADFNGASLKRSHFTEAIAADTFFENSTLTESDLTGADFTGANFRKTDLTGSVVTGAIFENSNMEEVVACNINAGNAIFTGANLSDGDFTEAYLKDADFSNTVLSFTSFMKVKAQGINLSGAKGEQTFFAYALLDGSRADKSTIFTDARFGNAFITRSCWEGAKLERAQMMAAVLDESDFSRCGFQSAILAFATARKTNFSKADLSNANLSAINLFKGSLRKSILTRADLKYSNLFGVDLYKAKLGKTRLVGANTKRTILIAQPEE
jgi:uncharacterized protein YjbI with pentapeptide repeats